MKQFSVAEILDFAMTIEEESRRFYSQAEKRLPSEDLRRLAAELAAAEVEHLEKLRRQAAKRAPGSPEHEQRVPVQAPDLERIVSGTAIPADAGARDILTTALERERSTENVYRMMQAATNLAADIVELFAYLAAQEAGHVKNIAGRLKAL
jgi:rubrerythrin